MSAATEIRRETQVGRKLANPRRRLEIRTDFPQTMSVHKPMQILETLEAELQKQGTTLKNVKRITLAYPHKHPELYPHHQNNAERIARALKRNMQDIAPGIRWIIADGLVETVHLGRSENQTSAHALMSQQIYEIHKPSQQEPCPFFESAPTGEKEFFMVVDQCVEQGTTVANLMSYITHNGGTVLAASTSYGGNCIAQREMEGEALPLSVPFNDASKNSRRLPELARVFSSSAKRMGFKWSPDECLDKFEKELNTVGQSVFTLTDGECDRLINTVKGTYYGGQESFPHLLERIQTTKPLKLCP